MPRKFEAIEAGDIIDDMSVISIERDYKNNRRMCLCRCNVCQREHLIYEGNLRDRGSSLHSVKCLKGVKKKDKKFYDVWDQMKARIYNENNHAYNHYGGKGLTTDYDDFVNFYDDMYAKYVEAKALNPGKKISIDRIDNNLGYVKGNLRWTDAKRQARNSTIVRKFIAVDPNGRVYLTNNQLQFGLNHGLESKHISDCLRGKQKTTAGWRFYEIDELFRYQYEADPTVIKELYY